MAKMFLAFLLCFTAGACATSPTRQVVGNKYLSEAPPLEIEFKYEIRDVVERGRDREIRFYTSEVKPVYVEIARPNLYTGIVDYYYSVETIASNLDYYLMGTPYFDDHKWAKVSKLNDHGWLMCGYLTRKDHYLVFIHNSVRLDSDGIERYETYQKTLKPSDRDIQFYNQMYDELDKSMSIIH